jgi:hypothetical protein
MFRNMRGERVAHMINALRNEGVVVGDTDIIMLNAFVKGEVSGQDLLAHACQFCTLSSYQEWLKKSFESHVDKLKPRPSVEQIVTEVKNYIRYKHEENSA